VAVIVATAKPHINASAEAIIRTPPQVIARFKVMLCSCPETDLPTQRWRITGHTRRLVSPSYDAD